MAARRRGAPRGGGLHRGAIRTSGLRPAWSEAFEPGALTEVPALGQLTRDWAFGGGTGAGVVVTVVDSGIDADHPAVVGPSGPSHSLSWDSDTEQVRVEEGPHGDLVGHGTACAGIIRRLAPECELRSVRVLGSRLSGKGPVFAEGLRLAIRSGAQVVNLSLSTGRPDMFAVFHEIADEAYFADVVLVCAMNNVPVPTFPSQYSSVISVAAAPGNDPFALWVNPHPPAEFGAPGIDIEVPWAGGTTMAMTGNSFAAPHVSGLVARLLSAHPELKPYEVKSVLRAVADNAVRR